MLIELFSLLNADTHYNKSIEIEILKGFFNKPISIKDRINKMKRKYNFNNGK